jgi:hypothetical protein
MNSFTQNLLVDNGIVDNQREFNENGQKNQSVYSVPHKEVIQRVNEKHREDVENIFKEKEAYLKNTYIDSDGNVCIIRLEEKPQPAITFISLWKGYGAGKMYDPNAPMQRRDKQHKPADRKQMLLSYIAGEDLGKFILMRQENGYYLIIDGRQRSSIIYEFLTDKMKLTGSDADNFWRWFCNDIYLYSNGLSEEDSLKCNKIIKSIIEGKSPAVVYSKLPSKIQDHIMYELSCACVVIQPQVFKMGRTLSKVDESQWDKTEVSDAITRKFIDINQFHKAIDKKDMIWGGKADAVRLVREFLEDKPSLGQKFGYKLIDKCENGFYQLDDTNEVRKLMILISRSLMIYQKSLQWGASESEIANLVLHTDDGDFTSQTKTIWKNWKKVIDGKIMSDSYYENGQTTRLFIPEEFTKSSSDILKLSYFLTTLYIMDIMLMDNYGALQQYMVSGEPTKKFYKLVEKVSIYLTLGKLANINHDEWNREDLPLVKYNLGQDFFSTEMFNGEEVGVILKKVKDLNQHQKGLSKDSENTIRTLIKYCETKI